MRQAFRGSGQHTLCIAGSVEQKARHNLVEAALIALPELSGVAVVVSCHLFCAVSESGRKGKKSHRGGSPSEAKLQEEDDCVHEDLYRTSYMTDKQH